MNPTPEEIKLFSKSIFKLPLEMLARAAIDNYIKKLAVSFVNESYSLYDKSNIIEQTFITEINKLISVYGSTSYFNKKAVNEIVQKISFNNPLKFLVSRDTIKNTLDFQLTKIDGNLPKLNDKKIYNFSMTEIGTKRKAQMNEPIETVIIRGQRNFDFHDVLNPVQIEINDDRILNILKKHKNIYHKLTPLGILFPSSVTNDTKQIFVTCRELNNAKTALMNGKIYNILGK